MKSDLTSLEAQLRDLRTSAFDEALLARLEAAADGSLTELTPDEVRFEQRLLEQQPAPLSDDFMAELESIVTQVPFPGEAVIVPFPRSRSEVVKNPRKRPMWAAAAAVALIGAATALMMPPGQSPAGRVVQSPQNSPTTTSVGNSSSASSMAGNLVPASFNRGVSEVHDEGVIWNSNKQPLSLVRVVYKDKIDFKDSNGRTYQVEHPRVEYMVVPAKTD